MAGQDGELRLPGPAVLLAGTGPDRLDTALWRAVAVARAASLAYVLASGGWYLHEGAYRRPAVAVAALAVMVGWTVLVTARLRIPAHRTRGLLGADLALACLLLLAGRLAQDRVTGIDAGQPSLTLTWGAIPVVAWAVRGGALGGGLAALAVSTATVLWRGDLTRPAVGSVVLLLLTGVVVGYVVQLARAAETAYAEVVQREATRNERDRLARQVHDGVLQTLALVSRDPTDPRLGRLAAEQEAALRRLVAGDVPAPTGTADLRTLLPVGADVSLAAPAEPVLLGAHRAYELAAAAAACVDNVQRHAGGTAWLLLEVEDGEVTLTVRDDGPGIAPARLEQAVAEGRLGLLQSVRGRVEDLGGRVTMTSAPGEGTEVELRVPAG